MGRSRYMSTIYTRIHRDEAHLNKRKYFLSCRLPVLSFEDIGVLENFRTKRGVDNGGNLRPAPSFISFCFLVADI